MAKKIKLAFKTESKLSRKDKEICRVIIYLIQQNLRPTGKFLADSTGLAPADVRHYIKLIRENNSEFFVDSYLIAYGSGYGITSSKKELKVYFKKLQAMTHSKVKQLNELDEVL